MRCFKHIGLLILSAILLSASVRAQAPEKKMTSQDYIQKYKDDAIREMLLYGIPASITLAQGMLESSDGNSPLALYANNHFGIKCHSDWTGPTYTMDDDKKNECFRKYKSPLDSYQDHVQFLRTRSRYAFLFNYKVTDYKDWAIGLKKAGYATDPRYSKRLIEIIEENKLYQYDTIKSLPDMPPRKVDLAVKETEPEISIPTTSVSKFNNIKCIIVNKGESIYKIAKDFDMGLWQIYKYNDLPKGDKLKVGERIFLQPKRRRGTEEFHVVQPGETMRDISQRYGIKLKVLYRKNRMRRGEEPQVGTKLWMWHKKRG